VLKHISTYNKTKLINKQQSREEQNHGQQYLLYIKPVLCSHYTEFSINLFIIKKIVHRVQ